MQDHRYCEPVRDLAAAAYEISGRLCGPCGDLHALWPYIRLAKASTGVEAQDSRLAAELGSFFARGLRNVLIAGSQDTGLLALVARAAAEMPVRIVVLDICETPLELCRRLAERWAFPIETIRQDLLDLTMKRQFDVVLVHGTLHFISTHRWTEALTRVRRAIRSNGRLVLFFNTSRPKAVEIYQDSGANYGSQVLTQLKLLDVPLPDTEAVMHERLNFHQQRRELREGAFAQPRAVELLLDAAGFKVKSCTPVEINVTSSTNTYIARISKRRFMVLAEPR
jgi:2-polyprenyl-3-methyl-5-hydroxy-6-metoxy-1,4-benzoquinol methylase